MSRAHCQKTNGHLAVDVHECVLQVAAAFVRQAQIMRRKQEYRLLRTNAKGFARLPPLSRRVHILIQTVMDYFNCSTFG
jgi:hypothetical protein